MGRRKTILSNAGHPLSVNEDKFINLYLELGNGSEAVIRAGYKSKTPRAYAQALLTKDYILQEIKFRRDKMYEAGVASGQEVMDFLTKVMRGEVADQFGLETPVSERLKAADMLAKRSIDIDNSMAGKKNMVTPEIQIKLDWGRETKEEDNDGK